MLDRGAREDADPSGCRTPDDDVALLAHLAVVAVGHDAAAGRGPAGQPRRALDRAGDGVAVPVGPDSSVAAGRQQDRVVRGVGDTAYRALGGGQHASEMAAQDVVGHGVLPHGGGLDGQGAQLETEGQARVLLAPGRRAELVGELAAFVRVRPTLRRHQQRRRDQGGDEQHGRPDEPPATTSALRGFGGDQELADLPRRRLLRLEGS